MPRIWRLVRTARRRGVLVIAIDSAFTGAALCRPMARVLALWLLLGVTSERGGELLELQAERWVIMLANG